MRIIQVSRDQFRQLWMEIPKDRRERMEWLPVSLSLVPFGVNVVVVPREEVSVHVFKGEELTVEMILNRFTEKQEAA